LKKAISLLFSFLFFLNIIGYYGVFLTLQYHNNVAVNERLDAMDYGHYETFELVIPLAVPYATGDHGFERVVGEFEYNGEFFHMIRQKLSHDTLIVVCGKDNRQKTIRNAIADVVRTFTGDSRTQSSTVKPLPPLIKDYIKLSIELRSDSPGWENTIAQSSHRKNLFSSYVPSIAHPPERG